MDAHFLEHHLNNRRAEIQRQVDAIRLENEAIGQRSGRLMRLVRVFFSRRRISTPATSTQPQPLRVPRHAVKIAR